MADSKARRLGSEDGYKLSTRTLKAEAYTVVNNIIHGKWQELWAHNTTGKGAMYKHLQTNVRKHTVMYSTNRREDVAYTRLRLQHLDLPTSRIWVKDTDPTCRLCRQSNETFEHIFFKCAANNHARRDLEAYMDKLGYRTFNRADLLAPPPKLTAAVARGVINFLKTTEYLTLI